MSESLDQILNLEVPVIVRLGEKTITMGEVLSMVPGMILELPKPVEDELELMVNNKPIGTGDAVKVGENFGIKLAFIGDIRERITALGAAAKPPTEEEQDIADAEALAEQLLAHQL